MIYKCVCSIGYRNRMNQKIKHSSEVKGTSICKMSWQYTSSWQGQRPETIGRSSSRFFDRSRWHNTFLLMPMRTGCKTRHRFRDTQERSLYPRAWDISAAGKFYLCQAATVSTRLAPAIEGHSALCCAPTCICEKKVHDRCSGGKQRDPYVKFMYKPFWRGQTDWTRIALI